MNFLCTPIAIVVGFAIVAIVGSSLNWWSGTAVEGLGTIGEWAIAFVIYYEIEANRSSHFLEQVQHSDFYKQRSALYKEYAELEMPLAATLKDRASAFDEILWKNEALRHKFDSQWANLVRLQYGVRWSLFHKNMIADWFPQVMISIWVMSAIYLHSRERKRGTASSDSYGYEAVRQCLHKMSKPAFVPIVIYSGDSTKAVTISTDELKRMLRNIDAPFI